MHFISGSYLAGKSVQYIAKNNSLRHHLIDSVFFVFVHLKAIWKSQTITSLTCFLPKVLTFLDSHSIINEANSKSLYCEPIINTIRKMGNKPLKRHEVLQPISREHHYHLLLCWKIRTGFRNKVAEERIKKYADWIFGNYIQPHFQLEEKYIFPLLPKGSELVKKALADHRRLTRLFQKKDDLVRSLSRIEEELDAHIRFEERILFADLQDRLDKEKWKSLAEVIEEKKFKENTEDEFWL